MKVEIDQNGKLTIKAETQIESYALDKWNKDWENKKSLLHVETFKQRMEINPPSIE